MSPFTLTSTCSRTSAWGDAENVSAASAAATVPTVILFSMCNSLESNILTERAEEGFQSRKHPAFGSRVLFGFPQDLFLRKARRYLAGSRTGRPPARLRRAA